MLKKISSDTLWYSILPQLPRLANFLLLPVTTPHLSPLDFAIFGTVMAYAIAFDTLKSLGLDMILLNSFFKKPNEYKVIWGKVEAIISVWSLVLSVLIGLIVYVILPDELAKSDKWFIVITTSLPSVFFAGLSKVSILFYQYKQNPIPIVVRSSLAGFLAVVINYITIVELNLGYKGWFYSGLITGILLPLSYVHPIWSREKILPRYRISWPELKEMLRVSLPIIPHHYATYFLNYSDRVLLNLFHIPMNQVGIYNLGYSVSGNFRLVTTSVDKVLGPTFHRLLTSGNDFTSIKPITFSLASGYLLIGFVGSIWMKEAFALLIRNDTLTSAYTIAIIILFSFVTRPLYNGAQSFLFFEERTSKLWRVTFMFGMLNIMLNVIFIPLYGINAAAVNTFICIAGSNYGIFLLKDYKETSKLNFFPLRWLAATLVVFAVSWFLKDASWLIKSAATALAVMCALSFVMRVRKSSAS